MNQTENTLPWSHIFVAADLPGKKPTRFSLIPDATLRAEIAHDLELSGLPKLTFKGEVSPAGRSGWIMKAQLGASVVQPCVVSLEPVKTRIDAEIRRQFVTEMPDQSETGESEIPEDVTFEQFSDSFDVGNVMVEALLLHAPMFPRAPGVEPVNITVTEPGVKPMTDEDVRPFAGLKSLRDNMENPSD